MFSKDEIFETIDMIKKNNLDIRTITMGISLIDCMDSDIDRSCKKIYDKIYRLAKDLVKVGNKLEKTYGIPIVNKRVSVTPISLLLGASKGDPLKYAKTLDKVANDIGIDFIGGYTALVQKGYSAGDLELINSIPEALANTTKLCSSVNVASTKAGINMDAVKLMGHIIKKAAILTKDNNCIGAGKLVVFCNAVEDNPFMAGAFHGFGEADAIINVGVSGPGVVKSAIHAASKDTDLSSIASIIKKTAFKITRMGELIGREASKELGVDFGIVDLSLAPTPAVGDSVAEVLEEIGLKECGAYGTTACLAMLNDAVKKGGVMACNRVGGLSGAFIPVSEDQGMIKAVTNGTLKLEKLEAMTCVCSVGLDMIVIPGDTNENIISGIIADEAAIGMVNTKTTAVRVIPAIGKKKGEVLNFGGLLGHAPVININQTDNSVFVNRGGQIPSPLQALKN